MAVSLPCRTWYSCLAMPVSPKGVVTDDPASASCSEAELISVHSRSSAHASPSTDEETRPVSSAMSALSEW